MSTMSLVRLSIIFLITFGWSANGQSIPSVVTTNASPNPATLGQPVTITATVTGGATGKVTFYDGLSVLGIAPVVSGQATFVTSFLASGARSLRAYYGGDSTFNPSASVPFVETVTAMPAGALRQVASASPGSHVPGLGLGDLNLDGKVDLVVLNSSNASVALGNGDGTFQPTIDFATGNGPSSLVVADFNMDGKPDVVVVNHCDSSSFLDIHLGKGNGALQPRVAIPSAIPLCSIGFAVSGDFNGDGKPDLVVAVRGSFLTAVVVFIGRGDGSFDPAVVNTIVDPMAGPRHVAVGDFNLDGKADLVTADEYSGKVGVLLGNGNGTFNAPVLYTAGEFAWAVASADVNNDGKTDLVVANSASGTVSVLIGNGNGTFSAPVASPAGSYPDSVAIGDLDADGNLDIVTANTASADIAVLNGNGNGSFQMPRSYALGTNALAVAIGEFNRDGRLDLVALTAAEVKVFAGSSAPIIKSLVPYYNGGDFRQFILTVSDEQGPNAISYVYFDIAPSLSGANSCLVEFNRPANAIRLASDSGATWPTPQPIESARELMSNGQCSLFTRAVSTTTSGNDLAINFVFSFSPSFAGTKQIFASAYDMAGNGSGWHNVGTYTVPTALPPVIQSIIPASGSGVSQTFSVNLLATDQGSFDGYIYLLINSTLNGASACFIEFRRATNTIRLVDDSGLVWPYPVPVGSSTAMSNSQCTLNGGASAGLAGIAFALNVPLTFAPGFSGPKNVYASAYNLNGLTSGWQPLGTWTVPGTTSLSVVGVAPAFGSGLTSTFAVTVSDSSGPSSIGYVYVLVNSAINGANSCFVEFNRATNAIRLVNDSGLTWPTPVPLGSGSPMSNSQCTLDPSRASTSVSGNKLTINVPLTFSFGYSGVKSVFASVYDVNGMGSGWQNTGTWTVGSVAPSIVSVTPSSGTASSATFSIRVSDPLGASYIADAYLLIGTGTGSPHACFVNYRQAAHSIRLMDDSGFFWPDFVPVGTGSPMSNSQCTLNAAGASTSVSGNILTLNIPLTFGREFTGAKVIYAFAEDVSLQSSGLSFAGGWNIAPPSVTAVSPSSGSGTSQTFSFSVSDVNGPASIGYVYLIVSSGLNAQNSCYIEYNRTTNSIRLAGNSGLIWPTPAPVGTGLPMSNAQCTLNPAAVTSSVLGNIVTLNVPLTFATPGYSGSKTVFAAAYDVNGQGNAWQSVSTWSVP